MYASLSSILRSAITALPVYTGRLHKDDATSLKSNGIRVIEHPSLASFWLERTNQNFFIHHRRQDKSIKRVQIPKGENPIDRLSQEVVRRALRHLHFRTSLFKWPSHRTPAGKEKVFPIRVILHTQDGKRAELEPKTKNDVFITPKEAVTFEIASTEEDLDIVFIHSHPKRSVLSHAGHTFDKSTSVRIKDISTLLPSSSKKTLCSKLIIFSGKRGAFDGFDFKALCKGSPQLRKAQSTSCSQEWNVTWYGFKVENGKAS